MSKVGVFSGTFDPVHVGHVEACLVAKGALDLDRVLVFLERKPRRKSEATDFRHRLVMTQSAFADYPSMQVVSEEFENITVNNTLSYLKKHYPKDKYVLIIGSDMLRHLESWDDTEELFKYFSFCVFLRDLKEKKQVNKYSDKLKEKYNIDISILPPVWSNVSSSGVKQELSESGTTDKLHHNVLEYIKQNRLYA